MWMWRPSEAKCAPLLLALGRAVSSPSARGRAWPAKEEETLLTPEGGEEEAEEGEDEDGRKGAENGDFLLVIWTVYE